VDQLLLTGLLTATVFVNAVAFADETKANYRHVDFHCTRAINALDVQKNETVQLDVTDTGEIHEWRDGDKVYSLRIAKKTEGSFQPVVSAAVSAPVNMADNQITFDEKSRSIDKVDGQVSVSNFSWRSTYTVKDGKRVPSTQTVDGVVRELDPDATFTRIYQDGTQVDAKALKPFDLGGASPQKILNFITICNYTSLKRKK
jgi:hypothetical protein